VLLEEEDVVELLGDGKRKRDEGPGGSLENEQEEEIEILEESASSGSVRKRGRRA
jgi:hypothetical protein